ncbi:MAG: hypothetical protein KGM99_12855, partial [Burkholderiales bacterium]|nr:hypothetical protein [Burkholderiales bacterium]
FTVSERSEIRAQQQTISVVPVYLVIRKNLPHARELQRRFDQGYQQLVDSGQLDKLIAAHQAELHIPH